MFCLLFVVAYTKHTHPQFVNSASKFNLFISEFIYETHLKRTYLDPHGATEMFKGATDNSNKKINI